MKKNNLQDITILGKFKINDDKVYMKKTGNVIYIIPYHNAWDSMVDATNKFSDDYMEQRVQPYNQNPETFDK